MINKPLKKNDHFMDVIKYECIYLKTNFGSDDYVAPDTREMFQGMGY